MAKAETKTKTEDRRRVVLHMDKSVHGEVEEKFGQGCTSMSEMYRNAINAGLRTAV